MNIKMLNTINLDDVIIKKVGSGGGGVKINNQDKDITVFSDSTTEIVADSGYTGLGKVTVTAKSNNQDKVIDIAENGTTEVIADEGFTGLGKVTVNVEVASSGGDSDMPVIGDGKTYLYIKIAEKGRMDIPLYFLLTVANGVTIDWGDGSAPLTLDNTGKVNTTHHYSDIGEYTISLNPAVGCTLKLGHSSDYCVMGGTYFTELPYRNMLKAAEVGQNTSLLYSFYKCETLKSVVFFLPEKSVYIGPYSFSACYSLSNIKFFVKKVAFGSEAFKSCYSLEKIELPNIYNSGTCTSVFASTNISNIVLQKETSVILQNMFEYMNSLIRVAALGNINSIGSYAFRSCSAMALYDFSNCTSVPTLNSYAFSNIPSDCKIVIPDALYDEWVEATNWSNYASYIIKKSDYDAL